MALRSVLGSSTLGPNSVVQNCRQRDFLVITEEFPLMTTSRSRDLNINEIKNRETRTKETIEDSDVPLLGSICDRLAQTRHSSILLLFFFTSVVKFFLL